MDLRTFCDAATAFRLRNGSNGESHIHSYEFILRFPLVFHKSLSIIDRCSMRATPGHLPKLCWMILPFVKCSQVMSLALQLLFLYLPPLEAVNDFKMLLDNDFDLKEDEMLLCMYQWMLSLMFFANKLNLVVPVRLLCRVKLIER